MAEAEETELREQNVPGPMPNTGDPGRVEDAVKEEAKEEE